MKAFHNFTKCVGRVLKTPFMASFKLKNYLLPIVTFSHMLIKKGKEAVKYSKRNILFVSVLCTLKLTARNLIESRAFA